MTLTNWARKQWDPGWQDDDVEAVFEISTEEDYPEEWLCDSLDADSMSVEEACWLHGYNAS